MTPMVKTLVQDALKDRKEKVKILEIEEVTAYIRINHPGPSGTQVRVHHLYENRYRVNYWGQRGRGSSVVASKWLYIEEQIDGFVTIKEY